MRAVQLVITGNLEDGSIQVQGPIGDMRLMHWLLGEARRCAEREADKRDAATGNGKILVATGLPGVPS